MKKFLYIHTIEWYSAVKKEETTDICNSMDESKKQ